MPDVSIVGIPELQANLKSLPDRIQKKVLRPALREAGNTILKRVKQQVPRKSGALAKSLKLRTVKQKRGTKNVVFQVITGAALFTGKTYYGGFLELGTAKIQARHFIAQAFQTSASSANAAAVLRLKEGIEREGALGASSSSGKVKATNFSAVKG